MKYPRSLNPRSSERNLYIFYIKSIHKHQRSRLLPSKVLLTEFYTSLLHILSRFIQLSLEKFTTKLLVWTSFFVLGVVLRLRISRFAERARANIRHNCFAHKKSLSKSCIRCLLRVTTAFLVVHIVSLPVIRTSMGMASFLGRLDGGRYSNPVSKNERLEFFPKKCSFLHVSSLTSSSMKKREDMQ